VTTLYELDVVSEEAILRWYNSKDRWGLVQDESRKSVRAFVFVFWLMALTFFIWHRLSSGWKKPIPRRKAILKTTTNKVSLL
jgi:hypothetical protein